MIHTSQLSKYILKRAKDLNNYSISKSNILGLTIIYQGISLSIISLHLVSDECDKQYDFYTLTCCLNSFSYSRSIFCFWIFNRKWIITQYYIFKVTVLIFIDTIYIACIFLMDKKASKLKSTLISIKPTKHTKRKGSKNLSARTPKHLESLIDQRPVHLSKFKTLHVKSSNQRVQSLLPHCTQFFNETEPSNGCKVYRTNQTDMDFPQSQSQKTIAIGKGDQKGKQGNKSLKTSKKNKTKKGCKFEIYTSESSQQHLTTRKSSLKKNNLKNILHRTEKILESYQKREEQWTRQKEMLVGQVELMRRKDVSKKALMHSASAYSHKKYLY